MPGAWIAIVTGVVTALVLAFHAAHAARPADPGPEGRLSAMRRPPLILTAALLSGLAACHRSAPTGAANAGGAAPVAPAAANAATANAGADNGLWGVAQAEDEASHRGIDFIAFNRTGRTVTALSLRPDEGPPDAGAPETPWSGNVLAQRELPDGQRAAAHFEADIELCRWSVRVTFAGGQTRDYPAVNLCETIRVDLR